MNEQNIEYIILHLSDLHIFEITEWKIMQGEYMNLIFDQNIKKCVVITGDLCQFGNEYSKTLDFLNTLVQKLKIKKTDIIIVPGNHDSKYFKDKEVYSFYIDNKTEDNPDCYFNYFNRVLGKSFKKYNTFVKNFYGDSWHGKHYKDPEQLQVINWHDKINFLCLNTAINSNGDNSLKQIVDIRGLSQLGDVFGDRPTVILAHHSFEQIHEKHKENLLYTINNYGISAYLCGDLHKIELHRINTNPALGESIPCIVCGKSSPENGDDYSDLGFILYIKECGSNELKVFPFKWNGSKKQFDISADFNYRGKTLCVPLLRFNNEMAISDIVKRAANSINDKSGRGEGRLVRFNDVSDQSMIEMPKLTVGENSVHLIELLKKDRKNNFLLVGKGGWGKTFMLLDAAKNFSNMEPNAISLYVPLNKLNDSTLSLLDLIFQSINDVSEYKLDKDAFKKWLGCSKWNSGDDPYLLLLLDGFNEITSHDITMKIVEEIHTFQVEYPRIRYVITSRYDISMEFIAGNSALPPFVGKEIQPIPEPVVKKYLAKNLGEKFDEKKITARLLDLLQRPMALMMYIKGEKNEQYALKHLNPQTLGELLDNYVGIILDSKLNSKAKNEQPKVYKKALDIINYIGYKMNCEGRFNITYGQLKDYLKDAKVQYKFDNEIDCEEFLSLSVVKDVLYIPDDFRIEENSNSKNSKYIHFFHQDFRDYFCALFLISLLILPKEEITEVFKNKLPNDALLLMSEILGEYKYIFGTDNDEENNSYIQQAMEKFRGKLLSDEAVAASQLIEVVRLGRNDKMGTFDFSNIDLTTTSLNNCKLYYFQNNNPICASFDKTVLSDDTFMPVGHAAAAYTMCLIGKRYLISFSAESAWCYDMDLLRHYKVASISDNSPIFASAFCPSLNLIVTGDRNGTVHIWKYTTDDETFCVELEKEKSFSVNSKIRGLISIDKNGDDSMFLFSTENGKAFCYFPKKNKTSCFFNYDKSDEMLHPLYTGGLMSVCQNKVYMGFGKEVFRIDLPTIEQEPIHSNQIAPYYVCTDNCVSFIYDIIVERISRNTVILLNVPPKNKNTDAYKVLEIVNGELKTAFLENKIITGNDDKGFCGYSVFQKGFEDNEFFLGATCESNSTPNLYRICLGRKNLQPDVKPIYGIQTMTIENIIPVINNLNSERDVITCSADRSVQVLCIDDNRESLVKHLPGHYNGVHTLDIISDSDNKDDIVIYVAQYSGALSAWKKDCENLWYSTNVFLLHKDWVWDVKHCEHDGKLYIITASYDGTVCVVDAQSEALIGIRKFSDKVLAIEVLTDDIICVAYNNSVEVLRIQYNTNLLEQVSKVTPCESANCRAIKNTSNGLLISTFVKNSSKSFVYRVVFDSTYEKYIIEHPKPYDGVIIRSISTLVLNDGKEIIAYGGTSCGESQKDIVIVCLGDETKPFDINSEKPGISSINLSYYNDVVYLVAASYSRFLYVFSVEITTDLEISPKCRLKYDNQLLDTKINDGMIYVASLSGNIFAYPLEEIESFVKEKNNQAGSEFVDIPEEKTMETCKKLFQTMAGFAMNYVNFSQSCKKWSEYVEKLIAQYGEL